jgi:hypothetical protein
MQLLGQDLRSLSWQAWGILRIMDERMLHALEAQRTEVYQRWEALLRVEPVKTPLGQPEALKHMIVFTLDTLFSYLQGPHAKKRTLRSVSASVADGTLCPCGRNPLLAYFVAGEQAVLETLVLAQASVLATAETRSIEVQELKQAMVHVALHEIETFCAVCQFRNQPQVALVSSGNAHASLPKS